MKTLITCCLTALLGTPAFANEITTEDQEFLPEVGFLLENIASFRRGGIDRFDAMETKLVRDGFEPMHPADGRTVDLGDGKQRTWKEVEFNEQGGLTRQELGRGGYVVVPIASQSDRVLMLHGSSHGGLTVNGTPHTANLYGYDYFHIPIRLESGHNELIVRGGRKGVKLRLYEPPAPCFLLEGDPTLPDTIRGEATDSWGAVLLSNTASVVTAGWRLRCRGPELETTVTELPLVAPNSIRKVGFALRSEPVGNATTPLTCHLELLDPNDAVVHAIRLELRRRDPTEAHKRTFVSQIDGSVQYYGLRRAVPLSDEDPAPAIVLSCHGASVKGIGQAAAYSAKSWLHLVAPTNRRPYGFDWEDMGRADAMEVLALARRDLAHDPDRIYLTGHSMGGHGTWHLGSLYPDQFAAIGPSAGWISYASYARRSVNTTERSPLQTLLARGQIIGNPIEFMDNLKQHAIYILHGGADDNVPASQARRMAELLAGEHHDWYYHEEPDKKHWWSTDLNDGGASCMDWPDMYDAFARHALPPRNSVRSVDFVTANPGVSSTCHWLAIEGQQHHHKISRASVRTWPNKRQFRGTTENVAVLRLDTSHLTSVGPLTIQLDETTLEDVAYAEGDRHIWLHKNDTEWERIDRPAKAQKGPHRYGAIKNALRHRFVFVYGTAGSETEDEWLLSKARLDAETLWYRGNSSVDVIEDRRFDAVAYADRTVVLYGNADNNSAWSELLDDSPVQVRAGEVRIGNDVVVGNDLACLFVRPREDSPFASVIAVAATGIPGVRLACKQSLFQPFVRYPDCVVLRVPVAPSTQATVERAGYFGLDWSISGGEFLAVKNGTD